MKPAIGQYWKDTVNGDLLKVLGFSCEYDDLMVEYVRCACFVAGRSFLGVQEMKSSRLDGVRFKLVKPWWWVRWKLTKQLYRRVPNPGTSASRSAKS